MFTSMKDSRQEDWALIAAEHAKHQYAKTPGLVLDLLHKLKDIQVGFAADQLTHCLMTATLAQADGASDEEVLIALCHDMGKAISIPNHGAIAAEILKPYVSDDASNAIRWHQHFQGAYYYNFFGKPTDMREQFRAASWFGLAERLVDRWDAPAFDPDFKVTPLEAFEPLIRKTFEMPINGMM